MLPYIAAAYITTFSILLIAFAVTIKEYLDKKTDFARKSNKK